MKIAAYHKIDNRLLTDPLFEDVNNLLGNKDRIILSDPGSEVEHIEESDQEFLYWDN